MVLAEAGSNFSIYRLVIHADPVVKAVLAILALASVACWAIIFEKAILLIRLNREMRHLQAGASPPDKATRGLARSLYAAAEQEAKIGAAHGERLTEVRTRVERAMRSALKTELQRVEVGLPFLATVGSTAPFVGLFGTVWGVMNSFTAIGQQQDTSLATVAPGIAEALFATALGLAAAIPAVLAYNHFAVRLGRAAARAGTAIAEIAKRISRAHTASLTENAADALRVGDSGALPVETTAQAGGEDQYRAGRSRDGDRAHGR